MSDLTDDRLTPEARLRTVTDAAFPWPVNIDGGLPHPLTLRFPYLPAAEIELAAYPHDRDSVRQLESRLHDRGVGAALDVEDDTPSIAFLIETDADAAGLTEYLLETLPAHAVAASHLRLALADAGIHSEVSVSDPISEWARCEQCRGRDVEAPHWCRRCLPPSVKLGALNPLDAARWLGVVLADRDWFDHRPVDAASLASVGFLFARNVGRVARVYLSPRAVWCCRGCNEHAPEALELDENLSTAATDRLTAAVKAADGQAADGRPPGPTGTPLSRDAPVPTPEAAARRLEQILRELLPYPPRVCVVEGGVQVEPIHADAVALLLHELPSVSCCWTFCDINPAAGPEAAEELLGAFRHELHDFFGEQIDVHLVQDKRYDVPCIAITKPLREGLAHRLADAIEGSLNARIEGSLNARRAPGNGSPPAAARSLTAASTPVPSAPERA
ncbi:hypothetical protein ACIQCG_01395 [Streptomyces noursei]|uniref:hypothetical protein n=1 Tax=Streptomyces noursei TaxID=1971 RepID=UPI003824BCA9